MGEIEVDTFLNQPLKAKIDVISARPGEVDDLLVSLASREAFRKAGLERPANLSKLRFKVEKAEDGQSATILISTKTPVKEPFLNFLVEADWAKGRLLREFTILLDPPHFAQQAPAPVPEAVAEPETAAVQPVAQPQTQPRTAAPAPIAEIITPETDQAGTTESQAMSQPIAMQQDQAADAAMAAMDSSDSITVGKGDTLWSIASRFKDADHSMGQVMLAMQAMNPEAFGDDNINNLKVGAVLRAPDQESLDRLSKQEAYAQVLEQNGLWDDYVARKTGSTTSGSPLATDLEGTDGQQGESQLSLLAPGDGDSTSASQQGKATSADAGQIRKQLALAEEELEASRLENQDLKSRIADLENQLGKFEELKKLVQIEDDSLAQLQDRVAQQPLMDESDTMKDDMSGMVEEQPTDVMVEAADAIMKEEAESDMMMDDTMVATGPQMPMDDSTEMQSTEAETVIDTLQPPADIMTEQPQPAGEQTDEKDEAVIPAPVIITEAPMGADDDGILGMLPSMDSILSDPIMLGGIGAILALLIGLLFIKRKKATKEEEPSTLLEDNIDDLVDDDATPIHVPGTEKPPAVEATAAEDLGDTSVIEPAAVPETTEAEEEDEFSSTAIISAEEMPQQEEPAAEEQDDVLNEVDVYLAYGLYDNAEDLLTESLQNSPDRADYRAKLLDTYFATKNTDSFVKEAEALKSLGGAADRYWDRVQIMGYELDSSNELFAAARDSELTAADLEYAKPEAADFDIGSEEDITDFSATDLDLGLASDDALAESGSTTQEISPMDGESGDAEDQPEALDKADDFDLPSLDDDEETVMREEDSAEIDSLDLPDEIGDFDIDLGDESEVDLSDDSAVDEAEPAAEKTEQIDIADAEMEANIDEDALNFDLPDDLDLSVGDDDSVVDEDSLIPLEPTVQEEYDGEIPPLEEDDGVDIDIDIEATDNVEMALDVPDEQDEEESDIAIDLDEDSDVSVIDLEDEVSQTVAIQPDAAEEMRAEIEKSAEQQADDSVEGTQHIEAALDMDMSDLENADLQTGSFTPMSDKAADDITEFRPADMTDEFSSLVESDEPLEEIDNTAGLEQTGTFAPGDFGDEDIEEEVSEPVDRDDIEDLMLPDDVDEVGTKLDLAKAFIDMGDAEGARSSLEEVLTEGSEEQQAEAKELLEKIK